MKAAYTIIKSMTFAIALGAASSASARVCILEFTGAEHTFIEAGQCMYLGTHEEMIATDGCASPLDPSIQFSAWAAPQYAGRLVSIAGYDGMRMVRSNGQGGGSMHSFQTGTLVALNPDGDTNAKALLCYRM